MQILHNVSSVGHRSGGVGAVALGMARAQLDSGLEVAIWCQGQPDESVQTAREWQLMQHITTYPTVGPSQIGFSPACECDAQGILGQTFTVFHQHGIWMANSRVTSIWQKTYGRPTVIAPHGTLEEYALKRSAWKKKLAMLAYEADNLDKASCLHATSVSEALSFRRYGLKNPIAIIPNGVPEDSLRQQGNASRFRAHFSIPPYSRILLFLSRLHPIKGLPLLFEAIARLSIAMTDWVMVVAGFSDPPGYQQELQQLVTKLGIADKVIFVGPLFGIDKQDAFTASDLFVLPTYSENFGIVIAEALAAGVPVLSTRGAPWEELGTNRCGWWVDISVDAISDALRNALRCAKGELQEMGQRGKLLVEQKYTWHGIARQTVELYEWLLMRKSIPDFVVND